MGSWYDNKRPDEKNAKAEAIRRRREIVMREDEEEDMMPAPAIKAKLEVSQPGDAQEQEADNIARKVVDGGNANINQLSATATIQSKTEGDTLHAPEGLQRQLDSSKGSGQSLPENVQQDIGGKMGTDLGDVKIHTGSNAHEMADSVNAKAFTHGQDIYFKDGNYDPGSKGGKELLAHEVVHTQQNGEGVGRKVWRKDDPKPLSELKDFFYSPMVWGIADSYQLITSSSLGNVSVADNIVSIQKTTETSSEDTPRVDPELRLPPVLIPMRSIVYRRRIKVEPKAGGEIYINIDASCAPYEVDKIDKLSAFMLLLVAGKKASLKYEIKGINTEKKWFYISAAYASDPGSIQALIGGIANSDYKSLVEYVALNEKYIATSINAIQKVQGFEPIIKNDEDVEFMMGRRGRDMYKLGIVAQDRFKVKYTPVPRNQDIDFLGYRGEVFLNEQVGVMKEYNGWFFIRNDRLFGWVEAQALAFDPPEPTATIHVVKSGETLWGLAKEYYAYKKEEDKRVFVNGIVFANIISNRKSQFKITKLPLPWEAIDYYHMDPQLQEGTTLWMPSKEFIQELRKQGKISSGSFTTEMWEAAKAVMDVVLYAAQFIVAFVGGLVVGFVTSIWDLVMAIVDLVKGIVTLIINIVTGEFFTDAKALYEALKNMTAEKFKAVLDAIGAAISDELEAYWAKMTSSNPWEAGYAWGWIIGYIIAEIVMIFLTAGGEFAAKWGVKLAKWLGEGWAIILKILTKIDKIPGVSKVKKIVTTTTKATKKIVKIAKEITPKTIKHIFQGEINASGKATGVHHIEAIINGTARIVPGTRKPGPNGLYKVIVEVKDAAGNWIRKTANGGYSTFFPDSWSRLKVLEEITHAFNNKVFVKGNTWLGTASDGTKIEMYLDKTGNIISAFPKF